MIVSLIILLGLIGLVVFYARAIAAKKNRPPGPLPVPFMNHDYLALGDMGENFLALHRKYGPVVEVLFLGKRTTSIADPKIFREASKNDAVVWRPVFSDKGLRILDMHEKGLIMNNNTDLWKKSKHLFLAAVNSHDFLSRAVDDLNLVWEEQLLPRLSGSAQSGQVVVLRTMIGEFIVGFQEKALFNQTTKIEVSGEAFQDTVAAFFRAWNFFLMIPEFLWDVVGNQKEHKAAIERFFEFERQTIQKRKSELDALTPEERAKAKDLIAVFFREGESFSKDPESKDAVVTDENIRELVHEALLGSLDTSWNTLCMVIWHMAHNQDVQEKLREEIREFLHKHPRVAFSNINERLPYLEAVITEVLRYAPTANMVFKSLSKDTSLGGYELEKGQTLFFHTEGITTNPQNFKSPEIFDPERFLTAKYGEVDPKIVFPFGQGRRICPGQSLGAIQLRYFLIMFFSKFKITTAPGNPSNLKSKYEIIRAVHEDSTRVFVELA